MESLDLNEDCFQECILLKVMIESFEILIKKFHVQLFLFKNF